MNCPPAIAKIILDIVGAGLLRIRAAGWSGDPGRCAAQADHLHNLPDLLTDFSQEKLEYYWDVERPSYAAHAADAAWFDELWEKLRPLVKQSERMTPSQP